LGILGRSSTNIFSFDAFMSLVVADDDDVDVDKVTKHSK